ncbi:MAG: hypothetical protein ACK42K_01520 [Leptonema sp. (in: bacteria)]|jgi:formate dehydrogenase maturation protein FdhE
MSNDTIIIIGILIGILSFLLWFIFDINIKNQSKEDKIRGYCPLCGHQLRSGERVRSEQIETAKVEIKTFIKGCPYCLTQRSDIKKRKCPICKNSLELNQTIVAISSIDEPKKLSIKGCKKCYPEGYLGYESKYQ